MSTEMASTPHEATASSRSDDSLLPSPRIPAAPSPVTGHGCARVPTDTDTDTVTRHGSPRIPTDHAAEHGQSNVNDVIPSSFRNTESTDVVVHREIEVSLDLGGCVSKPVLPMAKNSGILFDMEDMFS